MCFPGTIWEKKPRLMSPRCFMRSWLRIIATSMLPMQLRPISQETSPFTTGIALDDRKLVERRQHDAFRISTLLFIICQVPSAVRNEAASAEPCADRSEEHTSELQSQFHLVCRLLLEK